MLFLSTSTACQTELCYYLLLVSLILFLFQFQLFFRKVKNKKNPVLTGFDCLLFCFSILVLKYKNEITRRH